MPQSVHLVPMTEWMVQERLSQDDSFQQAIPVAGQSILVHFGAEWPGVAVELFPRFLTMLQAGEDLDTHLVVHVDSAEAVGMIGVVDVDLDAGAVEIGYGINPSAWGCGFATEAVRQTVEMLSARPDVETVIASTGVDNAASGRVLSKNQFQQVGSGWSEEDGTLINWSRAVR